MIKLVMHNISIIKYIYNIYKELGKINIFTCLSETCLIENNFKSICPMNNLIAAVITVQKVAIDF